MNALDVRKIREKYNLTQSELAKIVGGTIRAVQSWEQGQRNITQSAVKLLEMYEKSQMLKGGSSQTIQGNHNMSAFVGDGNKDITMSVGGQTEYVHKLESENKELKAEVEKKDIEITYLKGSVQEKDKLITEKDNLLSEKERFIGFMIKQKE